MQAVCRASPSLALIKYWGKQEGGENLTATPSLAVALGGLNTMTRVRPARTDAVVLDGKVQDRKRYGAFFSRLRERLGTDVHFHVESRNDFPSAAGLASSSSGFAALTCACARLVGADPAASELSDIARYGSASAARAVFGGFVLLPAGARSAEPLYSPDHWPELRIVLAVTTAEKKGYSSRWAMENSRMTSPYYDAWVRGSAGLLTPALEALKERDLEKLGSMVRLSTMRMHASMLANDPPLLYWLPSTLAVIRECEGMRGEGIGAWETIDAGPQVKILCLRRDSERIARRIDKLPFDVRTVVAEPGEAPDCRLEEE